MPKVVRCVMCGRLCGSKVFNAEPCKKGNVCESCFITYVKPAIKEQQEKERRKYR